MTTDQSTSVAALPPMPTRYGFREKHGYEGGEKLVEASDGWLVHWDDYVALRARVTPSAPGAVLPEPTPYVREWISNMRILQVGEPPDTKNGQAVDYIDKLRAAASGLYDENQRLRAHRDELAGIISRLRGECDANDELRQFVCYADHEVSLTRSHFSLVIDFAQAQMKRAIAAEASAQAAVARADRNSAAADIVLALVTLKSYKDAKGKDALYEIEQPKAWALAKQFLEAAMPEEYAAIDAALNPPSPG